MLLGGTVLVYCENHTEHTDVYKTNSYLTGITSRLRYKSKPVNAIWGNSRCLLWEPYGTHRYTVWAERRVLACWIGWYILSPLRSTWLLWCSPQCLSFQSDLFLTTGQFNILMSDSSMHSSALGRALDHLVCSEAIPFRACKLNFEIIDLDLLR
jgi:hypothetical protein